MKRPTVFLLVMVLLLAWAGGAPAASGPPKAACLEIGGAWTLSMAIKVQGTVKKKSGPVKFYSINGEINGDNFSQPVIGTGHLKGTVFHFSLTGTNRNKDSGELHTYFMEAEWDLAKSDSQPIYFRTDDDIHNPGTSSTFSVVDCAGGDLLY